MQMMCAQRITKALLVMIRRLKCTIWYTLGSELGCSGVYSLERAGFGVFSRYPPPLFGVIELWDVCVCGYVKV